MDKLQLNTLDIGFMPSGLRYLDRVLPKIISLADFIEISVQDQRASTQYKILQNFFDEGVFDDFTIANKYIVLHGEGEMDGKRRIKLASFDTQKRLDYITFLSDSYQDFKYNFGDLIKSVVLHPDSLRNSKHQDKKIELLVDSLIRLEDELYPVNLVIESRGSKDRKVLRPTFEDISTFHEILKERGAKNIYQCFDIAQCFILAGQEGLVDLLQKLNTFNIPICEFHVSDVRISSLKIPQTAQMVGSGLIRWDQVIPLLKGKRMLIETIGGVNVFNRSIEFLSKLGNTLGDIKKGFSSKPLALPSHQTSHPLSKNVCSHVFYYQRDDSSLFKHSPSTKQVIKTCFDQEIIPEHILDLGCGNGRNSLAIASTFGAKITLIDEVQNTLYDAMSNIEKHGCCVDAVVASPIEEIEPNDFEPFDIVLLNYVLQNIHPKSYHKILLMMHKLTKHFLIIDIYQNQSIYEAGTFSYRENIGWYGFRKFELTKILRSGFNIVWKEGSANKTFPTTLGFILSPLDKFSQEAFNDYPGRIHERNLAQGIRRKSIVRETYRKRSGMTVSPSGIISKIQNKSLMRKSYPMCANCFETICLGDKCEIIQRWVRSLFKRYPLNFQLSNEEYKHNKLYFQHYYRKCKQCSIEKCLGTQCDDLLDWIKKIKNGEVPEKGIKRILKKDNEKRLQNESVAEIKIISLPSEIFDELSKAAKIVLEKYPFIQHLSRPAQLYIVSRINIIPVSLREICNHFGKDRSKIFKEISNFQKKGVIKFKPIDFTDYIKRYVKILPLSSETIKILQNLILYINENTYSRKKVIGGSSILTAAAFFYFSMQLSEKTMTLTSLSKKFNVSEVGIRNKVNSIQNLLTNSQIKNLRMKRRIS